MTIDQLVQELQESIAKAEAATSGKWYVQERAGIESDCGPVALVYKTEDRIHIADAHNNGPRYWRMLLAAIHEARRWEDYNRTGYPILRAIQKIEPFIPQATQDWLAKIQQVNAQGPLVTPHELSDLRRFLQTSIGEGYKSGIIERLIGFYESFFAGGTDAKLGLASVRPDPTPPASISPVTPSQPVEVPSQEKIDAEVRRDAAIAALRVLWVVLSDAEQKKAGRTLLTKVAKDKGLSEWVQMEFKQMLAALDESRANAAIDLLKSRQSTETADKTM